MNITITPTETTGISRRLQISVPPDTVAEFEDKAARKYAGQVNLPGFRKGKAPPAMVRKKFSEAIRQEAIELVINEAFKEAVERESLQLAAQPHVHGVKFEPGEALEFELHCELKPDVSLEKVEGFVLARREAPVNDESVAEQLEKMREQKGDWAPVDDKALPGDMVTVLLSTADADGNLPEGKEFRLTMGGGQAIAGIEELIMEVSPGETSERPVRWPDDFPDEAQRGTTKTVRVTVNDVKRQTKPDLDDAFAREMGDFDDLDALKAAVRTDMSDHARREADAELRGQLIENIIEANPFEVPESWVRHVTDGYMQMYGVPEQQKEQFVSEFRPMAERQVRRDLVIDKIAERESLTANASDVDTRIEQLAKARDLDPGQVYAQLQKAGRLQEIEREITEDKVFTWLLERNSVTTA